MNGVTPQGRPMCKVIITPGDGWSNVDPLKFLTAEFDTHGMFQGPDTTFLRVPVAGIYSIIANVNWASGASVESEFGIIVRETPSHPSWPTNMVARTYSGFGTSHRQYVETLVNLRVNDWVGLGLLPASRSSSIVPVTTTGLRACHLITQYISPSVPNRGANGTAYDFR